MDDKPNRHMVLYSECDPKMMTGYADREWAAVKTSTYTGDVNNAIWGTLSIELTAGTDTTGVKVGELWVVAVIEVTSPTRPIPTEGRLRVVLTTPTVAKPLGTSRTTLVQSDSTTGISLSDTVATFGSGHVDGVFEMTWLINGTSASFTAPSLTFGAGLTALNIWKDTAGVGAGWTTYTAPTDAVTTTKAMLVTRFRVKSATAATVTFGTAGALPTSATGQLLIDCIGRGLVDSEQ